MELTKSKEQEGGEVTETPEETREFDDILEQAAPKLAEMARLAREAKRQGRVMKFPA